MVSIRTKISGTAERPRLCVHRSNSNIYVQIIDDVAGNTLVQASTLDKEVKEKHANKVAAKEVGSLIAKRATAKKIKEVVFDRGGYIYHGVIEEVAKAQNIPCKKGDVLCSDCFDPYLPDKDAIVNRAPKDLNLIASEMESFALFYNAKRENKKAVCILTVSDVPKSKKAISAEERQNSMDNMIKIALDTAIKLK